MMTKLFLSVLETSLSVSPVLVLLLLLSPLLNRRYAAKWSYMIWIFLAVRMLVPFDAEDGRAAVEMLSKWREQAVTEPAPQAASQDGQGGMEALPGREAPARIVLELPARITAPLAPSETGGMTALDGIVCAWGIGCVVYLGINLVCYLHFKRRVQTRGRVVKDKALLGQLFRLKRELNIRRSVTVVEFSEAGSPMLIGYLHPVLIVNQGILGNSNKPGQPRDQELYFILKHELVHCKRGDLYGKLLFMAVCALHWFNPLVWLMQKEAVVDMELSCDEKVIKGMFPTQKRAYTETLYSTLHKGGVRNQVISTGFYEGKKVMKKRFQNILRKESKKNGFCILACAVVLTLGMGMLAGCSVIRDKTEAGDNADNGAAGAGGNTENRVAGESTENGTMGVESDTVTLTFMKEGQPEEKQAELAREREYILYLPVGEWQKTEGDIWQAVANEDVRLWVAGFTDSYPVELLLTDEGYLPADGGMAKKEEGLCYRAKLYQEENRSWCVFYCYPEDAEEGWGRELPVIADTFAVIVPGERISEDFMADSVQVLGYISRFGNGSVTIDRQDWVTPEDPVWKPEYDADAGFEIVDVAGEDVTYPLGSGCRYFILEHHQGESREIDEAAFADYLRETDFPMFWSVEVKEGQVTGFAEWYRP